MTTRQTLDVLNIIQAEATIGTFHYVFGHDLGEHLWQRFNQDDQNIIALYNRLDSHNREQFAVYVDFVAEKRLQEVGA